MKPVSPARGHITKMLGIATFASLSVGLLAEAATAQQAPAPSPPQVTTELPTFENWRSAMKRLPLSKSGCFKSSYPIIQWQEIPCTTPPPRPYPPARGPRPGTVGNGTDISAQATGGSITGAEGSFPTTSGVTSETGVITPNSTCTPVLGPNAFSLQLNTNTFSGPNNTKASSNPPLCAGAANPSNCAGWQQFVYSNTGTAFMQYWLINYNAICPSSWNKFCLNNVCSLWDCWRNSDNAVSYPSQTIGDLTNELSLVGTAKLGGVDTIIISGANGINSATGQDSVMTLAQNQNWTTAEFNIFGELLCRSGQLQQRIHDCREYDAQQRHHECSLLSGGGVHR